MDRHHLVVGLVDHRLVGGLVELHHSNKWHSNSNKWVNIVDRHLVEGLVEHRHSIKCHLHSIWPINSKWNRDLHLWDSLVDHLVKDNLL